VDRSAPEKVAALLDEAERVAAAQGVPMLGLRIAMTAAQLDLYTCDASRAARRVRAALVHITEDDDTSDLIAARAMAGTEMLA
jgi:hypothetical protein